MKKRKISQKIFNFNTLFVEEVDGGYSVSVPSLPGCFSQGDSFEEAVKNIQEAIELYLEGENGASFKDLRSQKSREFIVPVEVHTR